MVWKSPPTYASGPKTMISVGAVVESVRLDEPDATEGADLAVEEVLGVGVLLGVGPAEFARSAVMTFAARLGADEGVVGAVGELRHQSALHLVTSVDDALGVAGDAA